MRDVNSFSVSVWRHSNSGNIAIADSKNRLTFFTIGFYIYARMKMIFARFRKGASQIKWQLHWFDEANIAMPIGIRNIAKQYKANEKDE